MCMCLCINANAHLSQHLPPVFAGEFSAPEANDSAGSNY